MKTKHMIRFSPMLLAAMILVALAGCAHHAAVEENLQPGEQAMEEATTAKPEAPMDRMARERARFAPGIVPGARHEQFTEGLPTLWLIGDSTTKANRDGGEMGQWGWGHEVDRYFDLKKINVENQALGGTSSRSYITLGYWGQVAPMIQPGDFVLVQMGRNDSGLNHQLARVRSRATLPGIGEETLEQDTESGEKLTAHTYGWYLRQYINDIRAAGATPILSSLLPQNDWRDGKLIRKEQDTLVLWARQVAEQEGVAYIDANNIVADNLDLMSEEFSKGALFSERDHTHTLLLGAQLNAMSVVQGIKALGEGCKLNEYLHITAQPIDPAAEGRVAAGK